MNRAAPRSTPPYRSERILRSAEQLLASTPTRPPRRVPAWVVFHGGLVIGIGAVILVQWLSRPQRIFEAAPVPDAEVEAPVLPRPVVAPQRSPAAARTAVAAPPATPTAVTIAARDLAPVDLAAPERFSREAALATFVQPGGHTAMMQSVAELRTGVFSRHSLQLILEGEMRVEGADPIRVQFTLSRSRENPLVRGTFIFFQTNQRATVRSVMGKLDQRTLTLEESEIVPTRPTRRTFTIQLPEAHVAGEVTGSWSNPPASGTLSLAIAPPW